MQPYHDVIELGSLVINKLHQIQKENGSFYTTFEQFCDDLLELALNKELAKNKFVGKHIVKFTVRVLRHVKIIKVVSQWVGFGLTLKQYSPNKKVHEDSMHDFCLCYIQYYKGERAWMKTAEEVYKSNIKKNAVKLSIIKVE